jgi:Holliday junction resolvase RusA-like endonuclease
MTVAHLLPSDGPGSCGTRPPAARAALSATERLPAGAGQSADLPAPASFTLPTPPSTNGLFLNKPGLGRVKKGAYEDFIRRGVAAIRGQHVQPIPGHVVAIFGVERMASNADIDNRLKSMLDTIVTAGVIADDSLVTAIAVSWLPKANGMAHVRLYPVQQLELSFHPSPSGACGGFFVAPSTQEDCQDGFPL